MGDAKRGKRGGGLPRNPVRAEAIGEDHLTWAGASAGWSHHCQTVAPQGSKYSQHSQSPAATGHCPTQQTPRDKGAGWCGQWARMLTNQT